MGVQLNIVLGYQMRLELFHADSFPIMHHHLGQLWHTCSLLLSAVQVVQTFKESTTSGSPSCIENTSNPLNVVHPGKIKSTSATFISIAQLCLEAPGTSPRQAPDSCNFRHPKSLSRTWTEDIGLQYDSAWKQEKACLRMPVIGESRCSPESRKWEAAACVFKVFSIRSMLPQAWMIHDWHRTLLQQTSNTCCLPLANRVAPTSHCLRSP